MEEGRTERVVVIGDPHLHPDPARIPDARDVAFRNFVDALTAEADLAA